MTSVGSGNASALRITGLQHAYASQTVLRDVELEVPAGQLLCLLGSSGCGKSTLLRLIAGLEHPTAGTLAISGDRNSVGYVFQHPNLLPWRRVMANVALPLQLQGCSRSTARSIAEERMGEVGLTPEDGRKWPRQLSGGMQMRASLARTLTREPSLMLMDEPFSALDEILRQQLNEDLRRWHSSNGWTTVFVTHNVGEALFLADRIVILRPAGAGRSSLAADRSVPFGPRDLKLRQSAEFLQLQAELTQQMREIRS